MTNTTAVLNIVDEIVTVNAIEYQLERTFRVSGEVLRIRVKRANTTRESWGVVQLLASDKTWTHLTQTDPAELVVDTISPSNEALNVYLYDAAKVTARDELEPIADELILRAVAILGL